ncbi:aldose epimerase family protein [Sunxiuqinia sp. A32]|uniref:aldose epimerase family protein n=1 Tax=Sunxiuqinia sp. A32 TaxID=3461496 RepID=UPI00404563CF
MKHIKSKRADFQAEVNGKQTDLYILKNKNGLEMAVTNFGARVVELWIPDKDGNFADVVLGHNNIDEYVNYEGERFLGATIGRFGNRIATGQFELDGVTYQLPLNNGPNSLHGGFNGFDMVVWDATQISDNEIEFRYISKDGEEGYPGTLSVDMTYQLTDDNEFVVTHRAVTDKSTIINLTHHSFFNLHGEGNGSINDHILMLNADKYTPVDSVLIPNGELGEVENTPMDFRIPTEIGSRLGVEFQQLKYGGGYDHNWVLNRKSDKDIELAATVYEPASGRFMEVLTTEPGIQFYGGNFFDGSIVGKCGKTYDYRGSLALETQHYPDSPNQPEFPSTVLNPAENYYHVCIYKFGVK